MNDFKLNKNKIETGFTTPENYFDDFSSKVMNQLPKNERKVISLISKRKTWMYAAVAILVLTLCIPVMNEFNTNSAALDIKAENNYITYNTRINQDDLIEHISLDELKDIKITSTNLDKEAVDNELLNDADLESYLINQTY